ncbi:MAG: twin-arginine translocase subunit TatC [Acidobacteriota bacterium]
MSEPVKDKSVSMTFLEHLDELRSRIWKSVIALVAAFIVCWIFSEQLLHFLFIPIREHLFEGEDIIFINLTEPFLIKMKVSFLAAIFLVSPFILFQLWRFIAPGLYPGERYFAVPFIFFSTLFFVGGGLFGYYIALPITAKFLLQMGEEFKAAITLRSAFQFESWILLGLGLIFEMPILIFFLSRLGVITPRFLISKLQYAVLIIFIVAAVITPTGDVVTLCVFALPMVGLYLIGTLISFVFQKRGRQERSV